MRSPYEDFSPKGKKRKRADLPPSHVSSLDPSLSSKSSDHPPPSSSSTNLHKPSISSQSQVPFSKDHIPSPPPPPPPTYMISSKSTARWENSTRGELKNSGSSSPKYSSHSYHLHRSSNNSSNYRKSYHRRSSFRSRSRSRSRSRESYSRHKDRRQDYSYSRQHRHSSPRSSYKRSYRYDHREDKRRYRGSSASRSSAEPILKDLINGSTNMLISETLKSERVNSVMSSETSPAPETAAPKEKIKGIDLYEKLAQVGEGTYGKVFKARHKVTGELVALKKIRLEEEREGFPLTAMREINLLNTHRNKNILQMKEIISTKNSFYMVFEYMDHDLTGILMNPNYSLEPCHIKSLVRQMFLGLNFLHSQNVLHRDIKGSNLLLTKEGILKLADFGLARTFVNKRICDFTNRVITLWYRPPELLLGSTKYGPAIDMWSAGCIMLELFNRKPVFPGNDEFSQLDLIFKICGSPSEENWRQVKDLPWFCFIKPKDEKPRCLRKLFSKCMSAEAINLIDQLLTLDPELRPSSEEVLHHPYFISEDPIVTEELRIPYLEEEWHEFEGKQRKKQASSVKTQKTSEKPSNAMKQRKTEKK